MNNFTNDETHFIPFNLMYYKECVVILFKDNANFSTITEDVSTVDFASENCTNFETKQLTVFATDKWNGANIRCSTVDLITRERLVSESTGPINLLVASKIIIVTYLYT